MNTQRIRQLLDQRDELDREIAAAVTGAAATPPASRKSGSCSLCGEEGHTARTCAKKNTLHEPRENGSLTPDLSSAS